MGVLKVKVISLPYIFQVLYVLCFSRPRYQVSVHRTIGPLVSSSIQGLLFHKIFWYFSLRQFLCWHCIASFQPISIVSSVV